MNKQHNMPFLNCGEVFNVTIPSELSPEAPPITLASTKVNINNAINPCILINYSQNLTFDFGGGVNPNLSIVYRLVRMSNQNGTARVLEQWNYRAAENISTQVPEILSIEPLVLNYCDCLESTCGESFTYLVQISEIVTNQSFFEISNQEISAMAF